MSEKPPSPTIEDYLGIIYTLQRDGEDVIGARLAELLEVSAPTVTVTLRRMARDGWINLGDGKHIQLSSAGVEAAKAVIRRHMLTEWMLAKILNLPWSRIHDEAHKIEHSISSEVETSLINKLEDPTECPHGNPMPGLESLSNHWVSLADCTVGEKVIIKRVHEFLEDDPDLMDFLEKQQVIPGKRVIIQEIQPLNKTITLQVDKQYFSLGIETAKSIFVENT